MTALIKLDLFQEYSGRTSMVEHGIVLKPDAVGKQMSYRIPERLLGSLKEEEVDLMLSLGIIQPSKSECNPVILVPKKDGTIRFVLTSGI